MAIRAVLFDWGGTIVRDDRVTTGAPSAALAAYASRALATDLAPAEFERAFHAVLPGYTPGVTETTPHISRLLAEAFAWLGLALHATDVEACARLFFREASRDFDVYDDARALLASLKYRGYRCGVITNAIYPAELFLPKVTELGLSGYFEAFVTSADVGRGKPNPAPYHRALAQLALEPREALFVGDMDATDVAGEKAAGMRAVLLARRGHADDHAGIDVIERLTALNGLLGEGPPG